LPTGAMRRDTRVDEVVDATRRHVGALEPAQHSLQPSIAERLPSRILRFDHTVGIPNNQITGS
jgi:hypothetical protein